MTTYTIKVRNITCAVQITRFQVETGKYTDFDSLWRAVRSSMMRHGYELLQICVD